jgi:hypothetical protein
LFVHLGGRAKASGLELEAVQPNGAGTFDIREGKVTKIVLWWDRDRALAELGLAPGGLSLTRNR